MRDARAVAGALVAAGIIAGTAADRLPDVAWPWYRLAELLAWAGFAERAQDHSEANAGGHDLRRHVETEIQLAEIRASNPRGNPVEWQHQ